MSSDVNHADVQDLSYEQARDELISVVGSLESGGIPLARSLALWQRAQLLADHCQVILDAARATVEESATGEDSTSDGTSTTTESSVTTGDRATVHGAGGD